MLRPYETQIMNRVRLIIFNAALGPLDYKVPDGMHVEHGSVVVAPLGPRQIIGIVWEEDRLPGDSVPDSKLRNIIEVLPVPPLKGELRRLMEWCSLRRLSMKRKRWLPSS